MDGAFVVFAAWSILTWTFWSAALKAGLGLGFVIFVHELGHFLVAKACGVKCEKFYVGFDVPIKIGPFQLPSSLFRKKWGETEYGIGIIPLGGYVKMLGQDDNPANAAKEAERTRLTPAEEGAPAKLDPRSFPAKPVWQRMAIISAGVITNLIFAVIFATLAYRWGVTYTPCVVGQTSPGLSAWQVGLEPGDRVVQIGRNGKKTEHLRFDKDMMLEVFITGGDKNLDLLVQRQGDPQREEWVTVRLSPRLKHLGDRPAIGIAPLRSNEVAWYWDGWETPPPADAGATSNPSIPLARWPEKVEAALKSTDLPAGTLLPGDRIVAINGKPVSGNIEIQSLLAQQAQAELTLSVERPSKSKGTEPSRFEVALPRRPMRGLGLEMEIGPITAIRQGSPAAQAGLREGDRLVSYNGQPIGNPVTFPGRINQLVGQPVKLVVARGSGKATQEVAVDVTPVAPHETQRDFSGAKPMASNALGLAYAVTNRVARVEPETPAAAQGIQPGDLILTAEFLPSKANEEKWTTLAQKQLDKSKAYALDDPSTTWLGVWSSLQDDFPDTQIKLTFQRGEGPEATKQVATMTPFDIPDTYLEDRGLYFAMAEELHQSNSWGESFALGLRETKEGITQVVATLRMLFTGQLSVTKLRGPGTIAAVAGAEASQSTSRLLVFLTLLSANLAVLNFLPIPVLDGGHAMFLLYEGIFRRPVDERVAFGLTLLGFSLIMGLMVFVVGMEVLDLVRPRA